MEEYSSLTQDGTRLDAKGRNCPTGGDVASPTFSLSKLRIETRQIRSFTSTGRVAIRRGLSGRRDRENFR